MAENRLLLPVQDCLVSVYQALYQEPYVFGGGSILLIPALGGGGR